MGDEKKDEGTGAAGGTGSAVDIKEFERLKTDKLQLEKEKLQLEKDQAKSRERIRDIEAKHDALRKVALGDGASDEDPRETLKKRDEEGRRRAADEADARRKGLEFALDLSKEMAREGLLPKDNDPDLIEFRIDRTPKLMELKTAGKPKELVAALKEAGFLVAVGTATTTPAMGRTSSGSATPPGRFDGIKTPADLLKLGPVGIAQYQTQHPKEYAALEAQMYSGMSRRT